MAAMMTAEQRAAARARCESATPGPWMQRKHPGDYAVIRVAGERKCATPGHDDCMVAQLITPDIGITGIGHLHEIVTADAEFIAHSRADLPAALATVDALTAENEQLKARLLELYNASRPIEAAIGVSTEDAHDALFVATGAAYHLLHTLGVATDTDSERAGGTSNG